MSYYLNYMYSTQGKTLNDLGDRYFQTPKGKKAFIRTISVSSASKIIGPVAIYIYNKIKEGTDSVRMQKAYTIPKPKSSMTYLAHISPPAGMSCVA